MIILSTEMIFLMGCATGAVLTIAVGVAYIVMTKHNAKPRLLPPRAAPAAPQPPPPVKSSAATDGMSKVLDSATNGIHTLAVYSDPNHNLWVSFKGQMFRARAVDHASYNFVFNSGSKFAS